MLTPDEVKVVARVLDLGRELAEQLDSVHADGTVEAQLLEVIDFLEELGVSSDKLTEGLDRSQGSG